MKKLPIFIDSNSLSHIPKIEKISKGKIFIEYFYPEIDKYLIKIKHIERVKEHYKLSENKNLRTYAYKNNELSKLLNSSKPLPYNRFHKILRPDSAGIFGQTFLGREALPNNMYGKLKRNVRELERFNRIVIKLEKLLSLNEKLNKDVYVLSTVLYVNNKYKFFQKLEKDNSFTYYLKIKNHIYFKPRQKLFLTNDTAFPFTPKGKNKIKQAFPNLSIMHTQEFIKDFDRFIS